MAKKIEDNTLQILKKQDNKQVESDKLRALKNILAQFGDKFCRRDVNLLHLATYETIDFYKSINDVHRGEEYAYDYTQVMKKLNKK